MPKDQKATRTKKPIAGRSVTIKDLAAELELSITTISRALNGYSDVGDKTRKRVSEMAQKLGYTPNRNAQRLVTQRTHNIAWVQTDNERKILDPHFVEVMAGVLRGARAGHYDIVLTSDTPEHQLAVYDRYVRNNSVDGFIIDLPQENDPRITFLLKASRPFVVHGRESRSAQYNWIDVDNFANYYDLTRLMLANGHKRIVFINGDEQFMFAKSRRSGVEAALVDAKLPPETVQILSASHPMGDAGFKLTAQALGDPTVTAIIYSSVLMAVEGHSAIVRAGRVAGENIEIGTMDDELNYLDLSPFTGQFTFIRSSLRTAGVTLIETLIHECEHKERGHGTVIPSVFHLAKNMDGSVLETPRGPAGQREI